MFNLVGIPLRVDNTTGFLTIKNVYEEKKTNKQKKKKKKKKINKKNNKTLALHHCLCMSVKRVRIFLSSWGLSLS